jgi:hypothetical protein
MRGVRPARTVGSATGWTRSLTSTAAMPGPAGLTLADVPNRIITAPCYMLEASLPQLQHNIQQALLALKQLLEA